MTLQNLILWLIAVAFVLLVMLIIVGKNYAVRQHEKQLRKDFQNNKDHYRDVKASFIEARKNKGKRIESSSKH